MLYNDFKHAPTRSNKLEGSKRSRVQATVHGPVFHTWNPNRAVFNDLFLSYSKTAALLEIGVEEIRGTETDGAVHTLSEHATLLAIQVSSFEGDHRVTLQNRWVTLHFCYLFTG